MRPRQSLGATLFHTRRGIVPRFQSSLSLSTIVIKLGNAQKRFQMPRVASQNVEESIELVGTRQLFQSQSLPLRNHPSKRREL